MLEEKSILYGAKKASNHCPKYVSVNSIMNVFGFWEYGIEEYISCRFVNDLYVTSVKVEKYLKFDM